MDLPELTDNTSCGIVSAVNFAKHLIDIGLVRIQAIGSSRTIPEGSIWWVTKAAAVQAVAEGRAEFKPLTAEEIADEARF